MDRKIFFESMITDLEDPLLDYDNLINICYIIENEIINDIIETNEDHVNIINNINHWIKLIKNIETLNNKNKEDKIMEIVNMAEDNFIKTENNNMMLNIAIINGLFEAFYNQLRAIVYFTLKNVNICDSNLHEADIIFKDIVISSLSKALAIGFVDKSDLD